jgi:hypothetical protein
MFNYDWFHRGGLTRLIDEAKRRCTERRFAELPSATPSERDEFRNQLEHRVILYLKDGLTYEMREIADVGMSSALAFECVPVDDNYKVGAIVLIVPFDDLARVEVFAVHPDDKPTENVKIPGFRSGAADSRRE